MFSPMSPLYPYDKKTFCSKKTYFIIVVENFRILLVSLTPFQGDTKIQASEDLFEIVDFYKCQIWILRIH